MTESTAAQATVGKDCVVGIHYKLTNPEGIILDQSDGEPLEYLQGHHNLIIGLEEAMEGRKVGDKFKVTIPAEKAYGKYDPKSRFSVKREDMGLENQVAVGMPVRLTTDNGIIFAHIVEISADKIVFDSNHHLAGVDLTFDVEVVSLRPATKEEIANGGLHTGCGGNCHSCSGCC
ncbi:peptidylprolyl isomerase [bacterium]|nr:peptidylprolyl isomerase [bacterium]